MLSAANDVDLMRRAPHTQHVEFYATCDASDETSALPGHGVIAIGSTFINLLRQSGSSASRNLLSRLKIIFAVWQSNIGIPTKWMLQSRPLKHSGSRMSKNY